MDLPHRTIDVFICLFFVKEPKPKDSKTIEGELQLMYPIGACGEHPDISCFHDRPTNLHHELTKVKLMVWAKHIVRLSFVVFVVFSTNCLYHLQVEGSATEHFLPNSAHFTREQAMKKRPPQQKSPSRSATPFASQHRSHSPEGPSRRRSASPTLRRNPYGYLGLQERDYHARFPPFPYMDLSYAPPIYPSTPPALPMWPPTPPLPSMWHGYPPASVPQSPQRPSAPVPVHPATSAPRSSPPPESSGAHTLEEFCVMTNLDDRIGSLLSQLGFQPGDDLSVLEPEDWKDVGFKKLEWMRVLGAATTYRRILKGDSRVR